MKREEPTIIEAVKILENYFSIMNEHFFENKLSKPVITISPDTTRGAYGWCTGWKAWKGTDSQDATDGYYEINLCADYLNRPIEKICGTLLHEMVHLYNLEKNVKDCSRSEKYHNKKFLDVAITHGLTVKKDEKYGWCYTELNDEAKAFVQTFADSNFVLHRPKMKKNEIYPNSSSRKYICPKCGEFTRSTHETYLICGICMVPLIEEKKG